MLNRLEISNYALIENVSLDLKDGFTVITGETGAGKSIILQALNLLLGERADTSVIKQNEKKCFLEAEFNVEKLQLKSFFEAHDLDFDPICLLRREFNQNGKSRCFVNDSPVQLSVLKELGKKLISIHTQHKTLQIFDSKFQMELLNHFSGIEKEVTEYGKLYGKYRTKVRELAELEAKEKEARKEKDYLEFLLNELEEADIDNSELNELKIKFEKIENAEQINESLGMARSVFESESASPLMSVDTLAKTFEDLKDYDPKFAEMAERLISLKIELQDVENEISLLDSETDYSPGEIQKIKDKIELLNSLLFKHNLSEPKQLVELRNSISEQLSGIHIVEDELKNVQVEIEKLRLDLESRALYIRERRTKNKETLEKSISKRLDDLLMQEAELKIELNPQEHLGPQGLDSISFQFKTNKGGHFAELKKIASGGELSRLMLSLLSILGKSKKLPTLIFDEIDTGVSGEVATKIAGTFQSMGKDLQLVAITHLPQVAGKGEYHLHVSKQAGDERTTTTVQALTDETRVQQLARMISGESITDAAKENARTLLNAS